MDNPAFEPELKESSKESKISAKVEDKKVGAVDNNDNNEVIGLKRELGLLSTIALVVGSMIGSGIFVSPGGLLKKTGSVWLSLIVWAACGLLSTMGAISYIELGTVVPSSGGEYSYFLRAFGPIPAFLFAWLSTILLKPSALAILCLAFAEYSVQPFVTDLSDVRWAVNLLCAASILILTYINCVSVSLAIRVQNFFTVAKLLAIFIIVGCGIYNLFIGKTEHFANGFEGSVFNFGTLASAFYNGLWSYDGWNQLNYVTEEIKNPYRNLPLALIIGLPLVTVCYLLVNISFLTVLSPQEIVSSSSVAIVFGNRILGVMAFLMPLSVACSTFGAANGGTLTSARLGFVAGREGHMVDFLSYLDSSRNTPSPAIIFNSVIALLMALSLDIEGLIDFFSFTAWMCYGGAMLALIRLRYTMPDGHRPFKVPLIIPILVLLISIFLVIAPIVDDPKIEYIYACGFILFGFVLYVPFIHYKKTVPGLGSVTKVLQIIFQVVPQDYQVPIKVNEKLSSSNNNTDKSK